MSRKKHRLAHITTRRARLAAAGRDPGSAFGAPTSPRLTEEQQRARRVTCRCGWSGPLSELQNPGAKDGMGPGFPTCPRCHGEELR